MKFNFLVEDYLMAPYIMPGSLIYGDQSKKANGNGRDLVVIEVKGKRYVGSFIEYGSYFHLIQARSNKAFLTKEVRVLGRVMNVFSKNKGASQNNKDNRM